MQSFSKISWVFVQLIKVIVKLNDDSFEIKTYWDSKIIFKEEYFGYKTLKVFLSKNFLLK